MTVRSSAHVAVAVLGVVCAFWARADIRLDTTTELFHEFNHGLNKFRVVDDRQIGDGHSVLVVASWSEYRRGERPTEVDAGRSTHAWGAFIFDGTADLVLVLEIAEVGGAGDIATATSSSCTLWTWLGDYGGGRFNTYLFDLAKREVTRTIRHGGVDIYHVARLGDEVFFLARDLVQRPIQTTTCLRLTDVDRALDPTAWRLTTEVQGRPIPIVDRALKDSDSLLLHARFAQIAYRRGEWTASAYGASSPFDTVYVESLRQTPHAPSFTRHQLEGRTLETGSGTYLVMGAIPSGIYNMGTNPPTFHQLPQPDMTAMASYRPEMWEIVTERPNSYQFVNEIRAFQLATDNIWFGVTFYDGEGLTGVGAIGYFDTQNDRYHLIQDSKIAPWSCDAILVEERYVWAGLARHPEGAVEPGGLARYERQTAAITVYDIPTVINAIRRYGDRLFLATSNGVYTLAGDILHRITLDFAPDGSYVITVTHVPNP